MSKPKNMTPEQDAICKERQRLASRKYREANKEKRHEYDRKYRAENSGRRRDSMRKWRAENSEKIKAANKKWVSENRDSVTNRQRDRRKNNPDQYLNYRRKYYDTNRDKLNKRRRENHPFKPKTERTDVKQISPSYVSLLLSIPTSILRRYPDLIAAKREQIQLHRQLKPTNKQNAQEPQQLAGSPR